MKKLMLDLDALRVDSFATGDGAAARGTVRAHDTRFTEFCNTRSCGAYTNCCLAADAEGAPPPVPVRVEEPIE